MREAAQDSENETAFLDGSQADIEGAIVAVKTREAELLRRCQNCNQPFTVKRLGKAHKIHNCGKCRHKRRN